MPLHDSPLSSAAALLPDQVAKLAAANQTLTSALQTAHADIGQLLQQRDELSDSCRSAHETLLDVCSSTSSWFAADLELCKRRAQQLRDSIASAQRMRARMAALLQRVDASAATLAAEA